MSQIITCQSILELPLSVNEVGSKDGTVSEIFCTEFNLKHTTFWDITRCSPLVNQCFGEHFVSIFKVEEYVEQESRTVITTYVHVGFLLGILFDPEYDGCMFLRNVGLTYNGLRGVIS
jgi:hypothetical protein